VVWLPVAPDTLPDLPSPTSIEPLEGGTLISSSPDQDRVPYRTSDADVAMIRDRNRRLHEAGLIPGPKRRD
jgi:hypothetical protein